MADPQKIAAEVKQLTARLEEGTKDLYSSEKYADYLKTMSKFYNYSMRNTMLIYMQMPTATQVAGFNAWKNDFKRHVIKGAKGLRILAPAPYIVKREMEKLDPDTQAPMLDTDGNPLTEEVNVTIPAFKPISVFDASQTDGEPLPTLVENLTGSVVHYEAFMDALKAVSVMPVSIAPLPPSTDGICDFDNQSITIREGMSEPQTIVALIHEMTHAELHEDKAHAAEHEQDDVDSQDEQGEPTEPKSKRSREVEAESVAYVVCQRYGIETAANSFGYITNWSAGKELDELKESLDLIRKTAASMIDRIDAALGEITKERGIDLTAAPEPLEQIGEIMPDPAIGVSERDLYGYDDQGMLPLLQERAIELFDANHAIYALHTDGTEAMVFDHEEIEAHDGIFGIETEDWLKSPEYEQLKAVEQARSESAPAQNDMPRENEDTYSIYQLKDGEELRDYRFAALNDLHSRGLGVARENYDMIYTAPLLHGDSLDTIYQRFNADHPTDYTGHSLSMSDVIVLQNGSQESAHYVDRTGFVEISEFMRGDTFSAQAQQQEGQTAAAPSYADTDAIATVAELKAAVDRGEQISVMALTRAVHNERSPVQKSSKPSILAQLQETKKAMPDSRSRENTAPKHHREVE